MYQQIVLRICCRSKKYLPIEKVFNKIKNIINQEKMNIFFEESTEIIIKCLKDDVQGVFSIIKYLRSIRL